MMSITSESRSLPALGKSEREQVGAELQATLVELVDLSLLGKQLHWSVVGPLFRPLHLYLDDLVESWRGLADTVAERAVAIGVWPDGQCQAVASGSDLQHLERGPIEDRLVLSELVERLSDAAAHSRGRMSRLSELDPASEDVLIEVVRALEEQLWMARAQLGR